MKQALHIGTRGSALALTQANMVADVLRARHPGLDCRIVVIKTAGDQIKGAAALRSAGKGVFVKELERALTAKKIDLAVHSLKDLPSELPRGLAIGAHLPREEAMDVFISRDGKKIAQLPPGSVIGTSSLRRRAFLLAAYPRLAFNELRGNVDTRLRKLRAPKSPYAGIVIAAAGLKRLYGKDAPAFERLDPAVVVPAAGQGTVAVEVRAKDKAVLALVSAINHAPSATASTAERLLQHRLEGGCQLPLGIHAEAAKGLKITVALASLDGRRVIRETATGALDEIEDLVRRLETSVRNQGAAEILAGINSRPRRVP